MASYSEMIEVVDRRVDTLSIRFEELSKKVSSLEKLLKDMKLKPLSTEDEGK